MAGLVTLATAKMHLRITDDAHDADVQRKADTASAAIVAYLAGAADASWTADAVPLEVEAAVLILLTWLYEPAGRGDALPAPSSENDRRPAPWETIDALLVQRRSSAFS